MVTCAVGQQISIECRGTERYGFCRTAKQIAKLILRAIKHIEVLNAHAYSHLIKGIWIQIVFIVQANVASGTRRSLQSRMRIKKEVPANTIQMYKSFFMMCSSYGSVIPESTTVPGIKLPLRSPSRDVTGKKRA
jgi:hypothetical protein